MARTKMEVDALAEKVARELQKRNDEKVEAFKAKAKKIYLKELAPLEKQLTSLQKKRNAKLKKLKLDYYYSNPETQISNLAMKLAKIKPVNHGDIYREIILAGDQGSDVLVKNLIKMFS